MTITQDTHAENMVQRVFEDYEHRELGDMNGEYSFSVHENGTEVGVERLENDTLLVLEQNPLARWEFIRHFADIYDEHHPYEHVRWGSAFSWENQQLNGELHDLYVAEWALEYVVAALKRITMDVLDGKYIPRRAAR